LEKLGIDFYALLENLQINSEPFFFDFVLGAHFLNCDFYKGLTLSNNFYLFQKVLASFLPNLKVFLHSQAFVVDLQVLFFSGFK